MNQILKGNLNIIPGQNGVCGYIENGKAFLDDGKSRKAISSAMFNDVKAKLKSEATKSFSRNSQEIENADFDKIALHYIMQKASKVTKKSKSFSSDSVDAVVTSENLAPTPRAIEGIEMNTLENDFLPTETISVYDFLSKYFLKFNTRPATSIATFANGGPNSAPISFSNVDGYIDTVSGKHTMHKVVLQDPELHIKSAKLTKPGTSLYDQANVARQFVGLANSPEYKKEEQYQRQADEFRAKGYTDSEAGLWSVIRKRAKDSNLDRVVTGFEGGFSHMITVLKAVEDATTTDYTALANKLIIPFIDFCNQYYKEEFLERKYRSVEGSSTAKGKYFPDTLAIPRDIYKSMQSFYVLRHQNAGKEMTFLEQFIARVQESFYSTEEGLGGVQFKVVMVNPKQEMEGMYSDDSNIPYYFWKLSGLIRSSSGERPDANLIHIEKGHDNSATGHYATLDYGVIPSVNDCTSSGLSVVIKVDSTATSTAISISDTTAATTQVTEEQIADSSLDS